MQEIVARRTRNAKHFDLGNGQVRAEIHAGPLHWHDGTAWRDYNLTFVGDEVTETDTIVRVTNQGIEITNRATGRGIRWRTTGKPIASGNKATGIVEGNAFDWIVTRTGVKIQATVAISLGSRTYTFAYDRLGGAAELTLEPDGSLVSSSDFRIAPLVVIDATGAQHFPATYSIVNQPGGRKGVRVAFDDTGISTPYTIDPTTTFFAGTEDGHVSSQNASYATARTGGTLAVQSGFFNVGQREFSGTYECVEAFVDFDTSSIPDADPVTAATLKLYGSQRFGNVDFTIMVASRDWGGTLTTADWVSGASLSTLTDVGSIHADSVIFTGYNNITITTSAINKTGATRFMLYSDRHEAGNQPGVGLDNRELMQFLASETSGTTQDPALEVTYGSSSTPISGTDSGTVGATESASIGIPTTDTDTVAVTEAATTSATLTATETPTIAATDTGTVAATLPSTDSGTVAATETASVAEVVEISATDSGTVTGTESAGSIDTGITAADSGTITGSETASLSATVSAADSGLVSASELASLVATLLASDSHVITITETGDVEIARFAAVLDASYRAYAALSGSYTTRQALDASYQARAALSGGYDVRHDLDGSYRTRVELDGGQ